MKVKNIVIASLFGSILSGTAAVADYDIQYGLFCDQTNAVLLKEGLDKKFENVIIKPVDTNLGVCYKVISEHNLDYTNAAALAKRQSEEFGMKFSISGDNKVEFNLENYLNDLVIDRTHAIKYNERKLSSNDIKKFKKYATNVDYQNSMKKRSIDMVVIHTTEDCAKACATQDEMVSYIKRSELAHYFIGRDGTVFQIVKPEYIANSTGQSVWEGIYDLDPNSINIEVHASVNYKYSGTDEVPINDEQYKSLKLLVWKLINDFEIPKERVLGHNQIAVTYKKGERQRKGDPGQNFKWDLIGLNNHYEILDPDILAGRAFNSDENKLCFKTYSIPGQVNAENKRNYVVSRK
ncbi:N-acetylmuramoyl-L-alanine amidase [Nanoarchaeota archaeon]